jgi:hypothetical protein
MRINSDTGVLEWTPPPSLILGDTVLGQIGLPGENDEFTFSGVLGQQIYFDPLQFTGSSFNWNFDVYAPSGQQIVNSDLQSSNNQLVKLTETGNYRIVVDANNDVTGSYGFSVIDLNLTPIAPFDTMIEGQLSPGSEDDVYRFTGNAGQKLFFDRLDSSGSLNWILYGPGNEVVTSNSSFGDMELYLPTDGEYKLAIRGTGSLTNITTYAFEIITPDEITKPMSLGSNDNPNSVFGEITEKGEEDFYTFKGSVGQRIYFDRLFLNSSFSSSHTFTLISPSGQSVLSRNFNQGDATAPISLLEDGTYRVRIDASGEATGSYSFNLLDVGLATSIELDTEYSGTLDVGQETHLYQFEGTAGQRIFIDTPGLTLGGTWTLYNSSNQQITSNSLNSDIEIVLNTTDTYILAIKGNNGSNPVNYSFEIITPDIITETLALDTDVITAITEKGERDIYTFTGSVGQRLFLDTLIDRSDFLATLVSPSGQNLINSVQMSSDANRTPVLLPEAGTYELIIDGSGEATGNYGFSLIDVGAAPVLEMETLTGGVLDPGKSIQFYQFTGNQGQRIYFDNQANSPGASWYLFNGSNNLLPRSTSAFLSNDFEYVLPADGTYYLMLVGESDTPINYNIQLVATTPAITPLTLNSPVVGEITKLGEQDIHTFEGAVGQTLYFDARNGNINLTVTLNSPSGKQILSGNTSSDRAPITLIEPGTYQLIVDGSGDTTGNYSFVLFDTTFPLPLGTSLNGNLNARETVLYQFNGTAGQRLEFDSLSNVSGADWVLYAPTTLLSGNNAVSSAALSSDFAVTLPVDGSYILALRNNSDSNVSYEIGVNDISPASVINSDVETLREGSISVAGEVDTYTFTANAGTLIYFDGQQGSSNFRTNLNNPDGTLVVSSLSTGFDSGAYLLAQTGDYTLEVRGNGSITGNYRFKLVDLKASPVLNLNAQQNVALNPLEIKAFKFTGTAGQKLWLDGLNTSNSNVTVSLLNSSGRQITSLSSLQSDLGLQTLEADGEYYLVLQSNNSAATTARFQLLDNSGATPLTFDTEIAGNFGTSQRESILYKFTGTQGQQLYFDSLEGDTFGFNLYYLYSPGGQQLFWQYLRQDQELVELPGDGEYTLVISGNGATNNNYNLRVVTPELVTDTLTIGETISNEISEAGEQDTYTFAGTVGQQLWLDSLINSSSITGTLYAPSGSQVWSWNFNGDRTPTILTETGTYRFVVDGNQDFTGAYSFRFLNLADAIPVSLDTEIAGNFGTSGREAQLYRFTGFQGQQLYFDRLEGDTGLRNLYYLYGPGGQQLFSQLLNQDQELVELPGDGEYTLVISGNGAANNNYNLRVVTPELVTDTLTIGETISNQISEAGEQDTYTFAGTVGQQLWFDSLINSSSITRTLYAPSGSQVWSWNFSFGDYREPTILTETGTYRFVIDASGDATGAYGFRFLDFADATPVNLDSEITGNFGTSGREAQLYRFTGSQGQQLYFDRLEGDTGLRNLYYLYGPGGQQLFSQLLNQDQELVELPGDGEYTLVISGNGAANNNYNLRVVTPELVTDTLTIGETISNEISEAGEQDTYTFAGTVGQQLWFDSLINSSSITRTLYAPSGSQVWSWNFSFGDRAPTILTETGTYRFVVDASGDATGAYGFRFLDLADATPVSLDTELAGDFGTSGREAQLYRFTGSEGQRLYFDVTQGDFNNFYYLYSPGGQQVFSSRLNLGFGGTFGDFDLAALPSSGEYTLVVSGFGAANNNYNLRIVTPEFVTDTLTLGEPITREISEAGEEDTYTFEGTVGQQLFFDALVGNSSLDAKLYSPSGNLVIDLSTVADGTPFTLTEAGTHRLVIDGVNDTIGNYSFRLSDRAEATPLELDTAIAGTLEPGNEVDLYQFTGTRGTILSFNLDAAFWSGANWVLYDPNNGVLAAPASSSPDFEVALPSDGLYTLAIAGNGSTTVNYSFQVTDNSVAPIPTTGTNITVTGTVANGGDVDNYTFQASAGKLIWLDQLSSTSSNIWARLKNPDGTFAFANHFTNSDRGVILLKQTGEYTLETYGSSSSTTGSWQFQLLELPANQQSTTFNPLALNSTIEGTVSPGTSARVYSFDGTIGQQILFNGIEGELVDVVLYDPNGQQLFSLNNYRYFDTDILTLTQNGIYHLIVDGNGSGERDFAFQLLDLAFASEVTANLPVQGSLPSGRESDIYRFSGTAGQRLFFDIKAGSSSARIKVYGSNNSELLKDTSLSTSFSFDLTLPKDGNYTIYIEGGSSSTPIDYEFQVFAYEPFADIVTPGTGDSASNNNGSLGLFSIQLQVEDGQGGKALQDFNIRLFPDPENTAPTIVSTPLQTQVGLNQKGYSYQLKSIDPDGDALSYRLVNAPLGALIDKDTGKLLWFPAESAIAGQTYNFTVEVSDGRGGSDSQSFDIEVFDMGSTIQGVVFEDLNQNGILDRTLVRGVDPDIFFVIDVSGSMGGSSINWSTANLETIFEQNLSPLDQELGAILVLSELLIARGRGNDSEIGIVTSGQTAIDMDPSQPGIQVSTTPLADNNNNGIRDIREVITGGVGGGLPTLVVFKQHGIYRRLCLEILILSLCPMGLSVLMNNWLLM